MKNETFEQITARYIGEGFSFYAALTLALEEIEFYSNDDDSEWKGPNDGEHAYCESRL